MKKLLSILSITATLFIANGCGGVADSINSATKNGLFGDNGFSKAIADSTTTTLNINVDTQYTTLTKIAFIRLDLTHQRMGDIKIVLISPSGTSAILANYRGGNKNIKDISFKDDAKESIVNFDTATSKYRPEQPLSVFIGENPKGIWKLKITDSVNNAKVGVVTGHVFFINGDK